MKPSLKLAIPLTLCVGLLPASTFAQVDTILTPAPSLRDSAELGKKTPIVISLPKADPGDVAKKMKTTDGAAAQKKGDVDTTAGAQEGGKQPTLTPAQRMMKARVEASDEGRRQGQK